MTTELVTYLVVICLFLFTAQCRAQITYGTRPCNVELFEQAVSLSVGDYEKWSELYGETNETTEVQIPCGRAVYVDRVGPITMARLHVDGLLFIPTDLGKITMTTRSVLVTGKLVMNGDELDDTGNVEFVLSNTGAGYGDLQLPISDLNRIGGIQGEPSLGASMGDRPFAVVGGQLDLRGIGSSCINKTFSELYSTAEPGNVEITVAGLLPSPCWRIGYTIVIAPTGYNRHEKEVRTIVGRRTVGANTVFSLNEPLQHNHYGQDVDFDVQGRQVRMAAEVALLSRPITIRGSDEGNAEGKGGHFIVAHTALSQTIIGIEFTNMGQLGQLGRYPLHFHMCGENEVSDVMGCSVHGSFQRGIVIHGSRRVRVHFNVLYNVRGHGIMAGEEGWEENNEFINNCGIYFNRIFPADLLPNSSDHNVAGLWISNPRNVFIGNRVIGSERTGIWFEMESGVKGASKQIQGAAAVKPRLLNVTQFEGHVSHSNAQHGLRLYPRVWRPTSLNNLVDVVSYKNNRFGIFMHAGRNAVFRGAILVDNARGAVDFDRQSASEVVDSYIIGKSHLGGICPNNGMSVEFHPGRNIQISPGSRIKNIIFDRFAGCGPIVGVDGTDRSQVMSPFPSSTRVENCTFLDTELEDTFSFGEAAGSPWKLRDFIALAVTHTKFPSSTYTSSYALSNTSFMRPLGAICANFEAGRICQDVCYRSLSLTLSTVPDTGIDYMVRVTRLSDNETSLIPPLKLSSTFQFWTALQTDVEYRLELVRPTGATIPPFIRLETGDANVGCTDGALRIRLVLDGFTLGEPLSHTQQAVLYDTCNDLPTNISTYYNLCSMSLPERQFVIPGGVPYVRGGITMRVTEAHVTCVTGLLAIFQTQMPPSWTTKANALDCISNDVAMVTNEFPSPALSFVRTQ